MNDFEPTPTRRELVLTLAVVAGVLAVSQLLML
jgi:hypothetical protein